MAATYKIEVKQKLQWQVAEKFDTKAEARKTFERYIETQDRPIQLVISRPRAKDGKIEELILREVKNPKKLREERRKVNEPQDDDVERLRERRGDYQYRNQRPSVSLGHMVFGMFRPRSDLPALTRLPFQKRILVIFLRACLIGAAAILVFALIVVPLLIAFY